MKRVRVFDDTVYEYKWYELDKRGRLYIDGQRYYERGSFLDYRVSGEEQYTYVSVTKLAYEEWYHEDSAGHNYRWTKWGKYGVPNPYKAPELTWIGQCDWEVNGKVCDRLGISVREGNKVYSRTHNVRFVCTHCRPMYESYVEATKEYEEINHMIRRLKHQIRITKRIKQNEQH